MHSTCKVLVVVTESGPFTPNENLKGKAGCCHLGRMLITGFTIEDLVFKTHRTTTTTVSTLLRLQIGAQVSSLELLSLSLDREIVVLQSCLFSKHFVLKTYLFQRCIPSFEMSIGVVHPLVFLYPIISCQQSHQ